MNKKLLPLKILKIIACAVLAIGVVTAFRACGLKDDGTWMKCHAVQNAVLASGIVMTVFAAAALFLKADFLTVVCDAVIAVLSIMSMLLPGKLMPMCMTRTMRCYTVMQPFVLLSCALIFGVAVLEAVMLLTRAKHAVKEKK